MAKTPTRVGRCRRRGGAKRKLASRRGQAGHGRTSPGLVGDGYATLRPHKIIRLAVTRVAGRVNNANVKPATRSIAGASFGGGATGAAFTRMIVVKASASENAAPHANTARVRLRRARSLPSVKANAAVAAVATSKRLPKSRMSLKLDAIGMIRDGSVG